MTIHTSPVAIALAAVAVGFGAVVSHVTYRAFRRTGDRSLRRLTVGFATLTLAVAAAAAHDVVSGGATAMLLQELLAALGFGAILYALYTRDDDPARDADSDPCSGTGSESGPGPEAESTLTHRI